MTDANRWAGDFELIEEVARGGMGVVYRARARSSGETVAVKLMSPTPAPTSSARFERERSLLARFDHPNIVRYLDHGQTDSGEAYLAMEWLEGQTLAQRLVRGRLDAEDALALTGGIAEALAAIHAVGVVHRDLKPSNIFLRDGDPGRPALLDFGVAHAPAELELLTRTGEILGTAAYMAPEQLRRAGEVGPAADVWSATCVLYEALTGRRAFEGASAIAVAGRILFEPPIRASLLAPDLPPVVDALVAAGFAKDPALRLADGRRLADAIRSTTARLGAPAGTEPALGSREERSATALLVRLPGGEHDGVRQEIMARLAQAGSVSELGAGLVAALMSESGTPTDRAVEALRLAHALVATLPALTVAVTSGRAEIGGRGPAGEVLERGAELLRRAEAGAVVRDEVTRHLESSDVTSPHAVVATRAERPHRLVGRARERAVIVAAIEASRDDGGAAAILLSGAPGIGKTALVGEILEEVLGVDPGPAVLRGAGHLLGGDDALGLASRILRQHLEAVTESGAHERMVPSLQALLERDGLGDERIGETIESLLTLLRLSEAAIELGTTLHDDPLWLGDRMKSAWIAWLGALCREHGAVLIIDDLQWVDEASLALVDRALGALREEPLLVIGLARPELAARAPELWSRRHLTRMTLGPLGRRAAGELVRTLLARDVDDWLVDKLVARTAGNPFFIGEMAHVLRRGDDVTWPETVIGTVQARIVARTPSERRVLRAASVFGERFWIDGVRDVLGRDASAEGLDEALTRLVDDELIGEEPSARANRDRRYRFAHALVREACYQLSPAADRAVAHGAAARWLEDNGHTDPAALAIHYHAAGESERAAHWHAVSAEAALEANDLAKTLREVEAGLACRPRPEVAAALHLYALEARFWRHDFGEIPPIAEAVCRLVDPGSLAWFRAVGTFVRSTGTRGEDDELVRDRWIAERLVAVPARDPDAARERAAQLGWAALSCALTGHGRLADELITTARDAMRTAELTANPWVVQPVARAAAIRAGQEGRYDDAIRHDEEALAASRDGGSLRRICHQLVSFAYTLSTLGDFGRARSMFEEAGAIVERLEMETWRGIIGHNLCRALTCLGELGEAERVGRESVAVLDASGDHNLADVARAYLAEVLLARGRVDEAEDMVDRALERQKNKPLIALTLAVQARVRLAQGGDPWTPASEAHRLSEVVVVDEGKALVRLMWARALDATGRTREAREALSAACADIEAQAARIADPIRRTLFLEAIPEHAESLRLARAWGLS